MASNRYGSDETTIRRFIREGRGRGEGKNYKPWYTVADVPSDGRSHRTYCPKTERVHHLLSDNEYYAFLLQWWDDDVIDIREQYPLLDRQETLEIAALCGISHPFDPVSGAVWVITTDQLVTVQTLHGTEYRAYSVKETEDVADPRILEKNEIERRYWERRDIKWEFKLDAVKNTFTDNLAWLYTSENLGIEHPVRVFDAKIQEMLAIERKIQPQTPICLVCRQVDSKIGLYEGTSLETMRRLIGAKLIRVNLKERDIQNQPIQAFSF